LLARLSSFSRLVLSRNNNNDSGAVLARAAPIYV
jgi:hypothetical protein